MADAKKVSEEFVIEAKAMQAELEAENAQVVLTSGRFDPPHPGHIIFLQKLMQEFSHLTVVILDYPDQQFPVSYRYKILKEALSMSEGSMDIEINTIHFGEITLEQIKKMGIYHVYAGGNLDVLKHLEAMGVPCIYRPREFEYAATDQRIAENLKKMLK